MMMEPNNPANDDRASPSPSLMVATTGEYPPSSVGRRQPPHTRSVPTNGDVVSIPPPTPVVMVTTHPVDWNSFFDCLIAVMLHTESMVPLICVVAWMVLVRLKRRIMRMLVLQSTTVPVPNVSRSATTRSIFFPFSKSTTALLASSSSSSLLSCSNNDN